MKGGYKTDGFCLYQPSYTPNSAPLTENKILNYSAAVQLRMQRQTREAKDGLHKAGREWAPAQEEALAGILRRRLKALGAPGSMAGVGRQIRHTGTFATASQAPSKQSNKNKEVSRDVAAKRTRAFTLLLRVHDRIRDANISGDIPLRPGHFIPALKPVRQGEENQVVTGEGSLLGSYAKSRA
ncbi:hypothetical protein AAF712_015782 [Marasmius tenuissimus]|uniref:Uncharacterized protein n=1 Tax=Marasmius tenuissimus TaxID=585030 RepID=A0ABR2Z9W1_9AGAR